MDNPFWKIYGDKLGDFKGRKVKTGDKFPGVEWVKSVNTGNSGAGAIGFAVHLGAQRVVLLGYDCRYGTKGKRHHHADHPPGAGGNAGSIAHWPRQFLRMAGIVRNKATVINCSRDTSLNCWPRQALESVINVADT